jgi:hypothetical protein
VSHTQGLPGHILANLGEEYWEGNASGEVERDGTHCFYCGSSVCPISRWVRRGYLPKVLFVGITDAVAIGPPAKRPTIVAGGVVVGLGADADVEVVFA